MKHFGFLEISCSQIGEVVTSDWERFSNSVKGWGGGKFVPLGESEILLGEFSTGLWEPEEERFWWFAPFTALCEYWISKSKLVWSVCQKSIKLKQK